MKTHINMSDDARARFDSIKSILETEREIKESDVDAIALLAINLGILDQAVFAVEQEGAMIQIVTKYGATFKQNPAVSMIHQTQQSIRSLMDSLLMTPKAKAAINKASIEKPEEDDPLMEMMKARSNRTRGE